MTLTVLLDLDDTLLLNDMNKFLPAYLQALSKAMGDSSGSQIARQVMAATGQMALNRDPSKTLEDVFDAAFYPAIGKSKSELWEQITHFYADEFPSLHYVTQPRPGAVEFVDHLFEQGHRVIIATDPLFPQAATLNRLAWAGLPVDRYPFTLISTYEHFHFSKPNLAYYAELLAQLGWPPDPVVMIGNDLDMDILPAAQLGIPAFWLSDLQLPAQVTTPSRAGAIEDATAWLEEVAEPANELHFDNPPALLAVLRSTAAALHTFTKGLSEQQWRRSPGQKEWSLTEIACHLRDVDREVNLPRLQQIMKEKNPFLPGVATDPWAEERAYAHQDGKAALETFLTVRMQITEILEKMSIDDWQRTARHAIFGPTTVKELVGFMATHDRVHVAQAKEAIAAR